MKLRTLDLNHSNNLLPALLTKNPNWWQLCLCLSQPDALGNMVVVHDQLVTNIRYFEHGHGWNFLNNQPDNE